MNIPQVTTYGVGQSNYTSYSDNSTNNSVAVLFDLSASINSEPLDPDLLQMVINAQDHDIGSQAGVIILDLVRILAQIRKQNQELWQSQSSLAYKTAFNTADAQKAHAKLTAISDMVNAGASIFQGVVEMGVSAVQARSLKNGMQKINSEADGMDFSAGAGVRNGEIATSAPGVRPTDAPPVYTEKASLGEIGDLVDSKAKGGADPIGNTHPQEAAEQAAGNDRATRRAKQDHINTAARNLHSELEMTQRSVTAVVSVLTNSGKMMGTLAQIQAGEKQAEATIMQAAMNYLQSQGTYSNDYASEMRENVKGVIDLIKSIEQARHQAASAITQIA